MLFNNKLAITAAALLMATTGAYAQFSNGTATGSADTDNYSRVWASFTTAKLAYDGKTDGVDADNGVSVGYLYGVNLTSSLPLFIEYGGTLTWLHRSEDEDGMDYKYNFMNISVPVNLSYKIAIPNTDFSIAPFAGISFKGNIVAKEKVEYDGDSEDWSLFDDEEDGGAEWNRFQVSGQVGVGINYKHLYLGYQFQGDFSELGEKTKYRTNTISIGYNF